MDRPCDHKELDMTERLTLLALDQGLIDYGQWAKFGLKPVLQIKFYWKIATCICFHGTCGCFCPARAEVNSCNRNRVDHKAENIYYLALYRTSLSTFELDD